MSFQVRSAAKVIKEGLELTVCGSFRRGKETCGDVDILITHPDGVSHENIFKPLLEKLKENGNFYPPKKRKFCIDITSH